MTLIPADPDFEVRTRTSHRAQNLMRTMAMEMVRVAPGEVDVEMPFDPALTESGGGLHGGTVTASMDTACASAAVSLQPVNRSVLTAELKTSFLRQAIGERFRFEGRVIKAGRNLVFTEGKCWAISDGQERLAATMAATMAVVARKPEP